MPSNKTRNTLARQWELLKMLPTRGAGKTAKEIADALAEAGFAVSKRQVERDLLDLQEVFGLECNDASIPYGWRWGAAPLELPGVTLAEALSLKLVEDTLKPLLPASVLRTIQPRLTQAKAKLAALSEQNPSARWAEKVASVSPSLPMMPPIVDEEILDTVQNALLSGEQICAVYKRISSDAKELTLHPLGLVIRGGVTYLVATAYDYADVRLFALHRFESAKRNYELVKTPKGFKLSSYLDDGALQFGSGVVVRLVARISDGLARHLEETPLAANQKLKSIEEGVQLTVSVPDTWQLHWWILSQGPSIVIVAPESLRERVAKALLEASGNYQSVNLE